jgi:hypothetical protein
MIHLPFHRVDHRSHQAKTRESDFQSGALALDFEIDQEATGFSVARQKASRALAY